MALVLYLQPKDKHNWSERYSYSKVEPYGIDLTYEVLKASVKEDSFMVLRRGLAQSLKPSKVKGKANYVFIGNTSYLTEADADSLSAFVAAGNDVFISTHEIYYELDRLFSFSACDTFQVWDYDELQISKQLEDSSVNINLTHPSLGFDKPLVYTFAPQNSPAIYRWSYFDLGQWCGGQDSVATLGSIGGQTNFIRKQHGKGYIYLHSTPILFTNYYMRDSLKLQYAERVFSHLQSSRIYWDEGSRTWHGADGEDYQNTPFGQSELKYILSQPASRWAFYTLLAGVVLYIVFYMKRRQRVIPVIEPYANTSIEYVQTVGGLYFIKQEHRKLAEQQFKLFLSFVRNRYRIPTQQLDDALIKKIAMASTVDEAQVRQLFTAYNTLSYQSDMGEEELIAFNQYLEKFYQNCK